MTLLDAILRRAASLGTRKAQPTAPSLPRWLLAGADNERWSMPDPSLVERQTDLYVKLSWIQIAVGIRARTAAATAFEVRQRDGEGSTPIVNHPFELLLQQPNPHESRFEFLESTFAWKATTGNCYWFLNRATPEEPPAELWIIPAHQIQPIPDGHSYIRGYFYDSGQGQQLLLEPWEVCHFKTWNPRNTYLGLSPLESLWADAYGDLGASQYNANFYGKDNAKPDGILAFADAIDDGLWRRLKAELREDHAGTQNKRLMMLRQVGPGGVQWISTQLSRQDMQYLEQRQFTKEEIFGMFAPGLAATLAINANEANARTGQANLRELAIYPDHMAIGEKITQSVLSSYGDGLTGAFEDVRHKDRQLELEEIREYARFHSVDEVRQRYYGDGGTGDYHGALFAAELKPVAPPTSMPADPAQPTDALAQAGKALDRRRWRDKAIKAIAAGRAADVPFDPEYLSDNEAMVIRAALAGASTPDRIWQAMGEG